MATDMDRSELLMPGGWPLEGVDPTPRIVAVEQSGRDGVVVYRRRSDGSVETLNDRLGAWLLAQRPEPWRSRGASEIDELSGTLELRFLIRFPSWATFTAAVQQARDSGDQFVAPGNAAEHYLMRTGRTMFRDMTFDDLRRLQLDIETLGLDPEMDDARIIMIALRIGDSAEQVLVLETTEKDLLDRCTAIVRELDPDVIEGHNIFNFDLPFLASRAARSGTELRWGRDGSSLRVGQRQTRFKVGPLTHPYRPSYIHGRHVIDTYQQIQRYDVGGRLTSYGLKPAVETLGLTRSGREFIPGPQIQHVWRTDPDRLIRYALDDVRDVDLLSRLTIPTEFYQAQILPSPLQGLATAGSGSKINDLMLRAYVAKGHSVPLPSPASDYPGGFAELIRTGVFSPVVKCDVESLYPSIMMRERFAPSSDTLGAFLPMLRELTNRRLAAKARSRTTSGAEQAMWSGMQASLKVLINSFYGYLGFSGALFNDFDAARSVTLTGQTLIKQIVSRLEAHDATPIEVDTDGVLFVPPERIQSVSDEIAFVEQEIGAVLPEGIRLAHDGRYRSMLSLSLKTYALLDQDDVLTLKGSALRSRRVEPFLREFLEQATRLFILDRRDAVRQLYFEVGQRIRSRELPPSAIAQWTMINEATLAKQERLAFLIRRQGLTIRSGERLEVYEREDGQLGLIEEYAGDENQTYLLRKLRDTAARFSPLFSSAGSFDAFFPLLSPRTDLDAARAQRSANQLGLF